MKLGVHRIVTLATLLSVCALAMAPSSAVFAAGETQSIAKIDKALERGARWLVTQQNVDGGFGPSFDPRLKGASDVGVSAFALYALARVPEAARKSAAVAIERGVKFLLTKQQPDGSFVDLRDPKLQNYKTSVAVLALTTVDRVKYNDAVQKAAEFIKSQQIADPRNLGYGGIGYGTRDTNPDLSNLQFALEALREAKISEASDTYTRAQLFLRKVQNLRGAKPTKIGTDSDGKPILRKSSGDGGFVYRIVDTRGPVETLDDGVQIFSSYGSMTYAGLKSLLHANVDRDDPRVKAAAEWISKTFTVSENPGMASPKDPLTGQQGLFYYYHTMAKALSVYGERSISDKRGREHDWAVELGEQIVKLQRPEGFWLNDADRWMEKLPILCASYSLITLSVCREEIAGR